MSENDAISRIRYQNARLLLDYYSELSSETYTIFENAASAKSTF